MAYPKEWRRYNPALEMIIRAWYGRGKLLETDFPSAKMAHKARQELYAFLRALARAKDDPKAEELREMSQDLTVRLVSPDGNSLAFVAKYDGPARLILCPPDWGKYGCPLDEILFQAGLKSPEADLLSPDRVARLQSLQAEVDEKRKEASSWSTAPLSSPQGKGPDLQENPIIALKSKRGLPPLAFPATKTSGRHLEQAMADLPALTPEEISQAKSNPFLPEMFDKIALKSPESAIRLAQRQALAFPPDSAQHQHAVLWLEKQACGGKNLENRG